VGLWIFFKKFGMTSTAKWKKPGGSNKKFFVGCRRGTGGVIMGVPKVDIDLEC
jgi:hypothetical protein